MPTLSLSGLFATTCRTIRQLRGTAGSWEVTRYPQAQAGRTFSGATRLERISRRALEGSSRRMLDRHRLISPAILASSVVVSARPNTTRLVLMVGDISVLRPTTAGSSPTTSHG